MSQSLFFDEELSSSSFEAQNEANPDPRQRPSTSNPRRDRAKSEHWTSAGALVEGSLDIDRQHSASIDSQILSRNALDSQLLSLESQLPPSGPYSYHYSPSEAMSELPPTPANSSSFLASLTTGSSNRNWFQDSVEGLSKMVRAKVSADKYRYRQGDIDLDLTYITDRIIAMSFPAEGVESTYRNALQDVATLLKLRHNGHFMIYNLAERAYDYDKFDNMVQHFSFPDHHAPPLAHLMKIVKSMDAWLTSDHRNVVAVHCLAGKGRTGTIIAAYLVFSGLFDTADHALNFFASRRSINNWGVTGPSQRRAVHDFTNIVLGYRPSPEPLFLKQVILEGIPRFDWDGCTPFFEIYDYTENKWELIATNGPKLATQSMAVTVAHSHLKPLPPDPTKYANNNFNLRTFTTRDQSCCLPVNVLLRGDIMIHIRHLQTSYFSAPTETLMARFSFHTGCIDPKNFVLLLEELDDAQGDSRFPLDFKLRCVWGKAPASYDPDPSTALLLEYESCLWNIGPTIPRTTQGAVCFFLEPPPSANDDPPAAASEKSSDELGSLTYLYANPPPYVFNQVREAQNSVFGDIGNRTVEMGGYLQKQGDVSTPTYEKGWKRRWFVLKDNMLSYFSSPRSQKALGAISLHLINEVVPDPGFNDCRFDVLTPTRTYYFIAENPPSRTQWMKAIIQSRQNLLEKTAASAAVAALSGNPMLLPARSEPLIPSHLSASSSLNPPRSELSSELPSFYSHKTQSSIMGGDSRKSESFHMSRHLASVESSGSGLDSSPTSPTFDYSPDDIVRISPRKKLGNLFVDLVNLEFLHCTSHPRNLFFVLTLLQDHKSTEIFKLPSKTETQFAISQLSQSPHFMSIYDNDHILTIEIFASHRFRPRQCLGMASLNLTEFIYTADGIVHLLSVPLTEKQNSSDVPILLTLNLQYVPILSISVSEVTLPLPPSSANIPSLPPAADLPPAEDLTQFLQHPLQKEKKERCFKALLPEDISTEDNNNPGTHLFDESCTLDCQKQHDIATLFGPDENLIQE